MASDGKLSQKPLLLFQDTAIKHFIPAADKLSKVC